METRLPTAQEAAIGFARRLRAQDLAEIVDFDSRVIILQTFTNNADELEQAIRRTSAGGSTSLYNAIYIALKELKKVIATDVEDIRRQAIVRAVGRRGHVEPAAVRGGARSREAVGDGDLRHRPAVDRERPRGRGFKEAEFVLRQLAQETGGRAFFPTQVTELAGDLHADRRRALEPVHRRLHVEERQARRRVAPHRRPRRPAERRPRGPSRATSRRPR